LYEKVKETEVFLKSKVKLLPSVGIILGSGLGDLVESIENRIEIDYSTIPNFPVSTVAGHAGKLVFGNIGNTNVVAMKGSFHFYEGYDMKNVTYPVYVMRQLGVKNLIVSNACGGTKIAFEPGTLMIITDYINFMGTNPLIGKNEDLFGARFPDMTEAFNPSLIETAKKVAKENHIDFKEGVYMAFTGPSYETAAEIRMAIAMGADAVGMSTVPETIIANYLGMKVLGISCITNMATGIAVKKHNHEDVVKVAEKAGKNFCRWVVEIIKTIQ
jgi:purine-nucleoside phosphorylase